MNVGQLFVLFGVKTNKAQFKVANDALKTLKSAVAVMGIARLGHELVNMATEAATSATHILGMSQALGMSTRSMQQWIYVAEQAGSNAQQFTRGISMLERNLREFAAGRGSKQFRESMHLLHMSQREVSADEKGPDGINAAIFKISDAYKAMGNNALRGAINQGLVGARNREMVQDLGKGSAAIKAQFEHLDKLGGVVDEEHLQNLKKFNNAINDIKVAWNAVVMQVVGGLAPAVSKLLEEVAEWIAKNKELIEKVLKVGFEGLTIAFKMFGAVVEYVMAQFDKAFNGDIGAQATLIAIAGAIVSVVVPALYLLAGALVTAMAPIALPMVFITALLILLLELRAHWDEIVTFMREHWMWFVGALLPFMIIPLLIIANWTKVKAALLAVGVAIIAAFAAVGRFFGHLGSVIWNALTSPIAPVKSGYHALIDWIIAKLHWAYRQAAKLANLLPGVHVRWGEETGAGDKTKPPAVSQTDRNVETMAARISAVRAQFSPKPSVNDVNVNFANAPMARPPAGSAAAMSMNAKQPERTAHVSVGPTTININGVKNATEAKDHIADSIDGMHRHAAAALGGEVQ